MLKIIVRETLKTILPSSAPPLLVASMGRSGSTLVYDALVEGMVRARFGAFPYRLNGLVKEEAWNLAGQTFYKGRVYKTHDLPSQFSSSDFPRVVFLFGLASDAARSVLHCEKTYGRAWIEEHFKHLSAIGELEDVPNRDVLRFADQLNAWLTFEGVPVLALRYEDLWNPETENILSRFAGFPVSFPERKNRKSISVELGAVGQRLNNTYADLDRRIAALPSVHLNARAQVLITNSSVAKIK